MKAGYLILDFHIEGCRSLKEKRKRLSGIRDRFGKKNNVAVCESDYQDNHMSAQWSFIAIACSGKGVDKTLDSIEEYIATTVDATITEVDRGYL